MESKLQVEIRQTKPFANMKEELWLNLSRTTSALGHTLEHQLRARGLSATQYNVLRILRGAGADGLCQWEIGARLVAQVPDVPRILERMVKAGWVQRVRGTEDRRVVLASLTDTGRALVGELDQPLVAMMLAMFPAMAEEEIVLLNELLVKARAGVPESGCEEQGQVTPLHRLIPKLKPSFVPAADERPTLKPRRT